MVDTPPLERQLLILRALLARRHGTTVKELAEEHQADQKTIRRDLDRLRAVGFPIKQEARDYGRNYWFCDRVQGIELQGFTYSEILSLFMARKFLEPLAGTPFFADVRSVFRKIKATLPEFAVEYLNKLAPLIHHVEYRRSDYADREAHLDELMEAVENSVVCRMKYCSPRVSELVDYEIHPYGVVHYRGSLYVVAYSVKHESQRHFKLDRIGHVERLGQKFQRPVNFRLEDHFQHSFGMIHAEGEPRRCLIWFSPQVQAYIMEHSWHKSQQLCPTDDGGVMLSMELSVFDEIKSWVLGFGVNAEVLEPLELREEIQQSISQMHARYAWSESAEMV